MEIGIDLYRGSADIRQGLQFDVGCVIMRLFRTFPGIAFEEEYYQRQVAAVERLINEMSGKGKGARSIAIRDAEELGPGFRFRVDGPLGTPLRGGLRRYSISFRFDDTVAPELREKAQAFVNSFS